MKFDMHCHTKEGSLDGKVPIEEFVRVLKEKGFDGMLVTDHDSYKGYRSWRERRADGGQEDFLVLKGVEYDTIDAGHILVIMPENVKLKILELRGLPVQFLTEIVHKNGGILGPAHPCGERYLSITNTRKHKNRLAVMDRFDFLEGFNACESPESNATAMEIAARYDKPVFGGSDAHKPDCVGLAYTEFQEPVRCESDLIRLVREKGRQACACGGEHYMGTTKEKMGRMNSLLVQSFWFYNHLASLMRARKRRRELGRLYIRIKA
ncbi:MAG: PHP domain-containing protein [Lachnospiraceae bacterium]|jgi:predicted metal-dependent phosphoesterase TrpH|nr:PHP domain-containing protein [uncultured Acetatifactor sp.]MCI9219485.1 PHP domain-containing protein [Lachnospiraceae bacterium]